VSVRLGVGGIGMEQAHQLPKGGSDSRFMPYRLSIMRLPLVWLWLASGEPDTEGKNDWCRDDQDRHPLLLQSP
jgi:hypothetical protein